MTDNTQRRQLWGLAGALLVCTFCTGCYDAQALLEARRKSSIRAQLEEVDLGEFRMALPQPYDVLQVAEIHFRPFVKVAHEDTIKLNKALENNRAKLQHQLLLAVRQLELSEIEDPELKALRNCIRQVVHELVPGEPVQTVGFHQFGFSNY